MTAHLSRRALLGAVPGLAAPMALLPASVAEAGAETAILQLYREWEPLRVAMFCPDATDEGIAPLYGPLLALEERIQPLPVTSLEDLAAKVSALASDEDTDPDGHATIPVGIVTECREILGSAAVLTPAPVPGQTTVPLPLPEKPDLSTMEGRIAAACEWFDLEPPILEYDPDPRLPGIVVTEELTAWMFASGVSLDWLVCGDPRSALAVGRKETLRQRDFKAAIREADPAEVGALTEALRLRVEHGVPLEACLEAWKRVVSEIRAAKDAMTLAAGVLT